LMGLYPVDLTGLLPGGHYYSLKALRYKGWQRF
jgi:hypothetical protein